MPVRRYVLLVCALILASFAVIHVASAHEVYVLDQGEITSALVAPRPDFLATVGDHFWQFIIWGFITLGAVLAVFFISINRLLEKLCDPILFKIKHYAPHIAQATLGLALIASGYYHDIFGVELPLATEFGIWAMLLSRLLVIIGVMLILGVFPRLAGMTVLAIFIALTIHLREYMLNYGTYLGEALAIVVFGGAYTIPFHRTKKSFGSRIFSKTIIKKFYPYKFLLMRVLFGMSLIYASIYAKFLHGALALEVVEKYSLTKYFHFDPTFLVLGAMLIEIALGLFFVLGFEIRFTSLFFLIFLFLSLIFFGEAVWPHFILIGTAIAMFVHGYDKYTVSVWLQKNKKLEPVL